MNIPIIIICYNNYKYVKNTLEQLLKINKEYYKNIQILNNNSTCLNTLNFLNNVDVKVINNSTNNGPWISNNNNKHIYDILPDKFILTDPDLKLNENIPVNFIEILSELSDKYRTSKIGFALDISDFEKFYKESIYCQSKSIYEWEKQFWTNKINDNNYDLYCQPIDTTFCLINKNYINYYEIRIAGNFTAKHLPWYIENKIYSTYENYIEIINQTTISTTSKIIKTYIENNYLKVYKKNEFFLIENNEDNQNLSFWKNIYNFWENETFEIFDKYLSQDKIFIDIGGWIGTTSIYGIRKSKHVYSIEADNKSFNDMNANLKINCTKNNYTLINKAIFNVDNIKIKFGKNIFLPNSKMNDSTSQIYNDDIINEEFYLVETITIENIIKNYQINTSEISLVKVDIEGGEENILNDLFDIHIKYNIPLYISFHYTWWKDKNLDRFVFLSYDIKNKIIAEPFTSILFN
jgi:FkbM family methyltransferase